MAPPKTPWSFEVPSAVQGETNGTAQLKHKDGFCKRGSMRHSALEKVIKRRKELTRGGGVAYAFCKRGSMTSLLQQGSRRCRQAGVTPLSDHCPSADRSLLFHCLACKCKSPRPAAQTGGEPGEI